MRGGFVFGDAKKTTLELELRVQTFRAGEWGSGALGRWRIEEWRIGWVEDWGIGGGFRIDREGGEIRR